MTEKKQNTEEENKQTMFLLEKKKELYPLFKVFLVNLMEQIKVHSLTNYDVITLMADLSAFALDVCKSEASTPEDKDALEDLFSDSLQTYLGLYEMQDVLEMTEKIRNEKLN